MPAPKQLPLRGNSVCVCYCARHIIFVALDGLSGTLGPCLLPSSLANGEGEQLVCGSGCQAVLKWQGFLPPDLLEG